MLVDKIFDDIKQLPYDMVHVRIFCEQNWMIFDDNDNIIGNNNHFN